MTQEIFADGISAIHVTGHLVRIDLVVDEGDGLPGLKGQPIMWRRKTSIRALMGSRTDRIEQVFHGRHASGNEKIFRG